MWKIGVTLFQLHRLHVRAGTWIHLINNDHFMYDYYAVGIINQHNVIILCYVFYSYSYIYSLHIIFIIFLSTWWNVY